MERMMDNETFDEVLNGFKEADSIVKRLKTRIAELEEENRKLKEYNENLIRADKKKTEHIEELEEENKNLKMSEKRYKNQYDFDEECLRKLEEENKKLKEENEKMRKHIRENGYIDDVAYIKKENAKLKEKVRFLEQCLDRKEKLNEKYRKELKNYVYDAKQVRDIC